ncbi:MAG: NAD(P)/FAD-dependent oxidoreductase [Rhodospirillaceae bacterium]|jgi:L-2-hydroxyglutarate oxidase LhgO|nr:NAD(P)/FAD-dependent oxidoreductase [Rhodospirillaceae bacterium]
MVEQVETVVVGAGVVGLAVARALAMSGREVVVLESEDAIGTQTSARNSEVIHGGMYYAKGSDKARLCVKGKQMLYDYCESHGVNHSRLGKLIVATADEEVPTLEEIRQKGITNGVHDLRYVEADEIRELEPNVNAARALLSPSTGLVDSHGLMLAYQGDAESCGAMLALTSPVDKGRIEGDRIVLDVGGETPMQLACKELVNSAGLGALALGASLDGLASEHVPEDPKLKAKGNYFILTGKSPFSRLIYPVPFVGGLGIHSTLDLGGQTKFGPDAQWIENPDYIVDESRVDGFYESIRRFWPDLPDGALTPGYAGVRPKLRGPEAGKYIDDFLIQGPKANGVPGLINLFGIESPGLTSSLAIAEDVLNLLQAS